MIRRMPKWVTMTVGVLLLTVGPLSTVLVFDILRRVTGWTTDDRMWGGLVLVVALVVGVVGVWLLPVRRSYRAFGTIAYLVLAAFPMWVLSLMVMCGWYGDCV